MRAPRKHRAVALCALVLAFAPIELARAQVEQEGRAEQEGQAEAGLAWSPGPGKFALGDQATIELGAGLMFADGDNTRTAMASMGNQISDQEVGLVASAEGDANWFLVFEYHPVGHVTDDDREEIDADALLQGMTEGTEEANEYRQEQGFDVIHVAGWMEPPSYDAATNNLTWAIRARDEDDSTPDLVNYNVRVLGREGFMSVTLVTDAPSFSTDRRAIDPILTGIAYNPGRRYAEYTRGDKLAGYGLTALVAGGAGAAAAKLGLFAYFGKFFAKAGKGVVLVFVAALAGIRRIFKSLFGESKPDQSV